MGTLFGPLLPTFHSPPQLTCSRVLRDGKFGMSSETRILKTVFILGGSWADEHGSAKEARVMRSVLAGRPPLPLSSGACSPVTLRPRAASSGSSFLIASSQGLGAPGKQTRMQVMLSRLPWRRWRKESLVEHGTTLCPWKQSFPTSSAFQCPPPQSGYAPIRSETPASLNQAPSLFWSCPNKESDAPSLKLLPPRCLIALSSSDTNHISGSTLLCHSRSLQKTTPLLLNVYH